VKEVCESLRLHAVQLDELALMWQRHREGI